MIIRSRYAYLADQTIAENIAVTIKDGLIRSVGDPKDKSGHVIDLGDAILLPGFVNAHTHLELGFAAQRVAPDRDFVHWLRRLMALIRRTPQEHFAQSVRDGLIQSLSAGVTSIADISRDPKLTRRVIAEVQTRPSVVSFGEVIAVGTLRESAESRIADAEHLDPNTPSIKIGISPHAPYTVEEAALKQCADRARSLGLPICIHAAETTEELQFTSQLDGKLYEFLRELDVWDDKIPAIGSSPIEYIDGCKALGESTLLAHCNYISDTDIALIRDRAAHVAYCPRTHAAFEHDAYPLEKLLAAGVNVCMGTDSLASNPDLSIREEIRFAAAQHRGIRPETLIDMATRNGAAALGLNTGAIESGKRADLIAIPLEATTSTQVLDAVISQNSKVHFVCAAGQIVCREA